MPSKDKPIQVKANAKGKQRAECKKKSTSDEGGNWLKEAWRRAGYTPFIKNAIAAKAAALGLRTEVACRS
jgi:hypothetical protein